ncbi:MAG: ribosome-associated translation inhibitor RaiA [Lentisphaeraceae bacterium]|nr:ribosome-associated translation inhibitor RaiA [Lentisphaeraceae bacterium]
MQVIISSRHFKAFKFIKSDITSSLEKFDRYEWKVNKVEVVLNQAHNKFHVEILISGKGIWLEAKAEEDVLSTAYVKAYDKAWRQMTKLIGKRKRHNAMHLADLEIMAMEEESHNLDMEYEVPA